VQQSASACLPSIHAAARLYTTTVKPPTFEGGRNPTRRLLRARSTAPLALRLEPARVRDAPGTSRDRTKCAARPRVNSGHAQPSAPKRATETTRSRQGDRTEEHPQSTGLGHTRRQLLGGPTRTAGFKQAIGSGKTCSRPQAALHVARCVAPRRRSMTRVYASVSEPGQDSCRQGDRSRSSAAAEGSPVCHAHFQDRECGVRWSVRSRRRDIDAWKD